MKKKMNLLFIQKIRLLIVVLLLSVGLDAQTNSRTQTDSILQVAVRMTGTSVDSALHLVDSLIPVYEKNKDLYGIGRSKSLKAYFLTFQARYEESIKLAHQALKVQKELGTDTTGLGLTYNRLGLANNYFHREADAFRYIEKALDIFTGLKDTALMDIALNNLGGLHTEHKRYQKGLDYYKQVLKLRLAADDHYWTGYAYFNIGTNWNLAGNADSAFYYLQKARETFIRNNLEVPSHVYSVLAELTSARGNYQQALDYAYSALKEATNLSHTEEELSAKKLLSDIHYKMGNFQQAYEYLSDFQSTQAILDSANSATRIAEIEEKYQNAEKEVVITRLQAEKLEANNEIQQSKLLMLYSIIVSIVVLSLVGYFYQQRIQKQRIEASELNAKIASTKLIALRAQMNPHFIFNCLNTTQNFIMASKKREAYEYLSKFAKLIRLVLENSQHTFIPLESEMNQIRLYLELECIRFNGKFSFDIEVDPELEGGVYEIPGMIIQPIVENAILHGLINRDDNNGHLHISMKKKNEDLLECSIEDNGVGRKKAAEIKSSKNVHYKSVALPNVMERLKILLDKHAHHVEMEITDLYQDEKPSGTRAILSIPFC